MNIDERIEALAASIDAQRVNIESLHSNVHELWEASQRHDRVIDKILVAVEQDGEHIRALARIAESHEHRITDLEGGSDEGQ